MKAYQKLIIDDSKRLFIVGDIHGSFDLYQKGCKDLGITRQDVVISLGDLVDRGPKNFASVVEFTRKENRYAILGNHEDMMVRGMLDNSHQHFETWFINGGAQTWEEVGGEEGSKLLSEMVKDCPVILEVEHQGKTFGCIHGGVPFSKLNHQTWEQIVLRAHGSTSYQNELVWDRSTIDLIQREQRMEEDPAKYILGVEGVDYLLHGHTPVKEPLVVNNRVYMDTGGVFNNKLTFAYMEGGELKFYTTGQWDNL